MKNHFPISYFGNKRKEVDRVYNTFKNQIQNCDKIIEPFAGTSALSYFLSKHYDDKKYFINDIDENLIKLYHICSDEKKSKIWTDKIKKMTLNEDGSFISKDDYLKIIKKKDCLYGWYISKKFYNVRPGLYPISAKSGKNIHKKIKDTEDFLKCNIRSFLQNEDINYSSVDAVSLIEKYKDDDKACIFLDPPYINTCNSFYNMNSEQKLTNVYEYLCNNNKNNFKCLLIIIVNQNWVTDLLFKGWNRILYDNNYMGQKKRKTVHMLLSNKNLK